MKKRANLKIEKKIILGTDVASFYIFHPDDLQDRIAAPCGWMDEGFAAQREFETGRVVAFVTGSDGGYGFRITSGDLTDRERTWAAGSWSFRLVVRHGRVLIDGGDALPEASYVRKVPADSDAWIELRNGSYRVEVTAIEWYSEPGALNERDYATENALASYVIQFQEIEDLSSIDPPTAMPILELERSRKPALNPTRSSDQVFDPPAEDLQATYPLIVYAEQAPIPGCELEITPNMKVAEAFVAHNSTRRKEPIREVVITTDEKYPGLGVLARYAGASRVGEGPWTVDFQAFQQVCIISAKKGKPLASCQVEIWNPPSSRPRKDAVERLKAAFESYARSNASYRQAVKHPDFEAERVASMNSPTALTNLLIHHIQMPVVNRLELLQLSNTDRIKRLIAIMQSAD